MADQPLAGVVREAAHRLAAAGSPSAQAEARTLVAHLLGTSPQRLFMIDRVEASITARLDEALVRREAGEPLQHITGEAWFRHVRLAVGPGVFVPRPETELLAGWAIDQLAGRRDAWVLEPCAGSGAISLAIADEAPGHHQVAIELSPAAHRWAAENLAGTGVDLRLGDLADAADDLAGRVDVVVVNPPYVPAHQQVPADVHHDPAMAVFAGADGLEMIRVIASRAPHWLKAHGVLGCEHDESHPDAVAALFEAVGLVDVVTHIDLAGRPRFTTAVAG